MGINPRPDNKLPFDSAEYMSRLWLGGKSLPLSDIAECSTTFKTNHELNKICGFQGDEDSSCGLHPQNGGSNKFLRNAGITTRRQGPDELNRTERKKNGEKREVVPLLFFTEHHAMKVYWGVEV
jgi:hypothetical protein